MAKSITSTCVEVLRDYLGEIIDRVDLYYLGSLVKTLTAPTITKTDTDTTRDIEFEFIDDTVDEYSVDEARLKYGVKLMSIQTGLDITKTATQILYIRWKLSLGFDVIG